MADIDPGLYPHCPKCPRTLCYIMHVEGTHIYQCPEHGRWRLGMDGGFYRLLTKLEIVGEALAALRRTRDHLGVIVFSVAAAISSS